MNRLLILLITICICSCCDTPDLLDNGLTKSANSLTEFTIRVKEDSTGKILMDTLVQTEKIYNNDDKIINRNQHNIFADEYLNIIFTYDKEENLIQETVELSQSNKPIIVSYTNENSKLQSSYSSSEYGGLSTKQTGSYDYSIFGILKKSTLHQIFVEIDSKDTISSTSEVSQFKNELVKKTTHVDKINPKRNKTLEFEYDCGTLTTTRTYNYKDSLVSTISYEYELDKYLNWIMKKSYENGNLTNIQTRLINYK